jgi:hypothetical protein
MSTSPEVSPVTVSIVTTPFDEALATLAIMEEFATERQNNSTPFMQSMLEIRNEQREVLGIRASIYHLQESRRIWLRDHFRTEGK